MRSLGIASWAIAASLAPLVLGTGSALHAGTLSSARSPSALWIGDQEFAADDIASVALDFDEVGLPVLDVALNPAAAARLAAATTKLQGQTADFKLDARLIDQPMVTAAITGGKFRISGGRTLPELKGLVRDIACALRLPKNMILGISGRERHCDPINQPR